MQLLIIKSPGIFREFDFLYITLLIYCSCRDSYSSKLLNVSSRLIDFSYIIDSSHGLVYFVTDYSVIESLVRQLTNLINLRLIYNWMYEYNN